MGYIRFVVPRPHEDSHRLSGVFSVAFDHWVRDDLEKCDRHHLGVLLDWFGDNLASPPVNDTRALFWFHGCCNPCTQRIWELSLILRELGEHPRLLKTRRPGTIVYEDEHQIAALPFRELSC